MILTPRLRGTPLAESDLPELLALHRDERVLSAFGSEPGTDEDTLEFIDEGVQNVLYRLHADTFSFGDFP